MKYVLVLWLTWNGGGTSPEGSIETAEFESSNSCSAALSEIIKKAKNVGGLCVKK